MSCAFVGWDVAGWQCPKLPTSSRGPRDALVVLSANPRLRVAACSGWTNFKSEILNGNDFVAQFVAKHVDSATETVLAIDAPLGWPSAFVDLLARRWTPSRRSDGYDLLLRRDTDRVCRGQSAVGQRLGSASSKAMAFLAGAGYVPAAPGVFRNPAGQTAIETYPASLRRTGQLKKLHHSLLSFVGPQKDFSDALWCALAAAAFGGVVPNVRLQKPPTSLVPAEGWIWTT